ncbi:MAG: hypothetical protein V3V10_02395 [Planctomycetota bacterium]
MSSKPIVTALVILLSVGAGVGIWRLTRSEPMAPSTPIQGKSEKKYIDIVAEFDTDGDQIVSFAEFKSVYGVKGVRTSVDGKKLSALQAFTSFDKNNDGKLTAADTKLLGDINWVKFQQQAKKDGYDARQFNGKNIRLNELQLAWYHDLKANFDLHYLPWKGQYLDRKYFTEWSQVTDAKDRSDRGFYFKRDEEKALLMKENGSLRVFDIAEITVTTIADAPQTEYASRVKSITIEDPKANLQLAQDCVKWGLPETAAQLFRRVLIFDGQNKTALKALKLKIVNKQYKPE